MLCKHSFLTVHILRIEPSFLVCDLNFMLPFKSRNQDFKAAYIPDRISFKIQCDFFMVTETYLVSCHMGLIPVLLENYFTTPEDIIMSKEGLIVVSSATEKQ